MKQSRILEKSLCRDLLVEKKEEEEDSYLCCWTLLCCWQPALGVWAHLHETGTAGHRGGRAWLHDTQEGGHSTGSFPMTPTVCQKAWIQYFWRHDTNIWGCIFICANLSTTNNSACPRMINSSASWETGFYVYCLEFEFLFSKRGLKRNNLSCQHTMQMWFFYTTRVHIYPHGLA